MFLRQQGTVLYHSASVCLVVQMGMQLSLPFKDAGVGRDAKGGVMFERRFK